MTTTLFRPVGINELALIWDKGMREFPPRLPEQPIFYPVANLEYACQIARDWNAAKSPWSAGYVTAFEVDEDYLANFELNRVGSSRHVEYWIPAAELDSFNEAIIGLIRVERGFFGSSFIGLIPEGFGLDGKNAVKQFVTLFRTWDYSGFDVVGVVYSNRKSVFLNWLFWSQHDFSEFGIGREQRQAFLGRLKQVWEFTHIEILLPKAIDD